MSPRAKSGIFVFAPIGGDVGARIAAVARQFDPRLAALDQAPHVTVAGSSGMGPIAPDTTREELDAAIAPIAASTTPITLRFGRPTRFMQTQIVVLPLDPHGPLRTLHERIKTSGLRAARPRFYFTPHVTLNLYRELPPGAVDLAPRRTIRRAGDDRDAGGPPHARYGRVAVAGELEAGRLTYVATS